MGDYVGGVGATRGRPPPARAHVAYALCYLRSLRWSRKRADGGDVSLLCSEQRQSELTLPTQSLRLSAPVRPSAPRWRLSYGLPMSDLGARLDRLGLDRYGAATFEENDVDLEVLVSEDHLRELGLPHGAPKEGTRGGRSVSGDAPSPLAAPTVARESSSLAAPPERRQIT